MPQRRSFLCFLAVLALTTSVGLASNHEIKPGVERWPIKTSVPEGGDLSHGTSVSYADFAKLDDPPGVTKNDQRYRAQRIPAFTNALGVKEGDVLTTTGWLHLVASEADGGYYIQISDQADSQASCIVVEVPKDDPVFVKSAPVREHARAVRAFIRSRLLENREPSPRGSVMRHPPFVRVTGQLFYNDAHVGDPPRGKKGCQAATLWELHPVTAISFARP